MIKGIGVDLVKIERVSKLTEYQIKRMFAPSEAERALSLVGREKEEFLASRYAAKEAFAKALGTGIRGFGLSDVEVKTDGKGAPYLSFSENIVPLVEGLNFHLSLSHEEDVAIAMVVCDEI